MASRLFGTKPLSEPMLIDCLLDSREKIVQIWSPWRNFPISKWVWKCSLKKTQPFFRPQCFNIPNYWFGPCFDASPEAAHTTKWHPWSTAVYIHGLHFQLYKWKTIMGLGDLHDDVIKWKYFPRYWPFVRGIHRSPVNSPHKGQWRRTLMFSLICVWINGRVNNREAGDLSRYRAHYDVIVMIWLFNTLGCKWFMSTCRQHIY